MRKKFGDWLLDIAKYMATAILLTSIFSDVVGSLYFARQDRKERKAHKA